MDESSLPYRFFALLHKTVFTTDRHANTLFVKERSGFSEFLILNALLHGDDLSQHNIAKFLNVTPASVSRRVDLLVERGFAKRTEDPNSRRTNRIALTPKGKVEIGRMQKILGSGFKDHVGVLTERDMESTCRVLQKLLDTFKHKTI